MEKPNSFPADSQSQKIIVGKNSLLKIFSCFRRAAPLGGFFRFHKMIHTTATALKYIPEVNFR